MQEKEQAIQLPIKESLSNVNLQKKQSSFSFNQGRKLVFKVRRVLQTIFHHLMFKYNVIRIWITIDSERIFIRTSSNLTNLIDLKPLIIPNSTIILLNKNIVSTPPQQRYQKDQINKKKWLENEVQKNQQIQREKEMNGVTFKPKISQQAQERQRRTPDQFYKENLRWQVEKLNNTQKIKEGLVKSAEDFSFKPRHCSKSIQMIQPGTFYHRLEEKKLKKELKIQQIERETTPSFRPNLWVRDELRQRQTSNRQNKDNYQSFQIQQRNNYSPQRYHEEYTSLNQKSQKKFSETFDFFENIRKKQYDQENSFQKTDQTEMIKDIETYFKVVPNQVSFSPTNLRNDQIIAADSAIWKMIHKNENSNQRFQQPSNELVETYTYQSQPKDQPHHLISFGRLDSNQNSSQELHFNNVKRPEKIQKQQNLTELLNSIQDNLKIDLGTIKKEENAKLYGQPRNPFNQPQQQQNAQRSPPQKILKRQYFNEKITSITDNIQRLFSQEEQKIKSRQMAQNLLNNGSRLSAHYPKNANQQNTGLPTFVQPSFNQISQPVNQQPVSQPKPTLEDISFRRSFQKHTTEAQNSPRRQPKILNFYEIFDIENKSPEEIQELASEYNQMLMDLDGQ